MSSLNYLQKSKAEILKYKINDYILIISTPKVDRKPSDPVNVIGVCVDQRNNINSLETQNESLLKGQFGSGNLQQATSNFINVNRVKNSKEITLRETIAALSEGHSN